MIQSISGQVFVDDSDQNTILVDIWNPCSGFRELDNDFSQPKDGAVMLFTKIARNHKLRRES